MQREQPQPISPGHKHTPSILPSGKIISSGCLAKATCLRTIRYPLATAAGIASALVAHAAVVSLVPNHAGLLVTSAFRLFAGIALFLILASLMVLDEDRLDHVARLFRTGALISILVTTVAVVPIVAGLMLMPADWQNAPQWSSLGDWWPAASIGFSVVALGCVFPAFLVAWPISARTGLPLPKSILFVWRDLENSSYASAKMSIFVGFVGWALVTLPGTGLLAPVLFSHLSAALFERLVIVGEQ